MRNEEDITSSHSNMSFKAKEKRTEGSFRKIKKIKRPFSRLFSSNTRATDEMKVLSNPPGCNLADSPGYTTREKLADSGVTVIYYDSGFDETAPFEVSFFNGQLLYR